jgi:predicted phosphodiesterase
MCPNLMNTKNTYLVLSDLHLTKRFEKGKERFLTNLIKKYDNIVLNGDFYESMVYTKNQLIKAGYGPFFKLLKSKNTTYLYGNHDHPKYSKELAEYVSKEQRDYKKINIGGFKYHIEHGHKLMKNHSKEPNPLKYKLTFYLYTLPQMILPFCTTLVGSTWNKQVLKNRYKFNRIKPNEILVCGHTHATVYDLKKKYIDLGRTQFGKGNYLVIDSNGAKLVRFKY